MLNSHNTKVIAKVMVRRGDGSLLLMKRSIHDEKGATAWDLPGGTVDYGEDFTAAACRELFEEAGIKLALTDLQLVYTRSGTFEQGNRCWLVFMAEVDASHEVVLSHEHDEYKWVPVEVACGTPMFQEQERALAYIAENILAH